MKRFLFLLLLPFFSCLTDAKLARLCTEKFPVKDITQVMVDSSIKILPIKLVDSLILQEILRIEYKKDTVLNIQFSKLDSQELQRFKYIVKTITITNTIVKEDSTKIFLAQLRVDSLQKIATYNYNLYQSTQKEKVVVEGRRTWWRNLALILAALTLGSLIGYFIKKGLFTSKL